MNKPENYVKNQIEKYYSSEETIGHYKEGQRRFCESMLHLLDRQSRVLDVACGDGVGLEWFKEQGFENVTGMELSPVKSATARKHGYTVLTSDMHEPINGTYDVIYSSHSLEHAYDPIKVLNNFYNALSSGGSLFVIVPFPDRGNLDAHGGKVYLHTDVGTEADVREVFTSVGFEHVGSMVDNYRENEIWITARKP